MDRFPSSTPSYLRPSPSILRRKRTPSHVVDEDTGEWDGDGEAGPGPGPGPGPGAGGDTASASSASAPRASFPTVDPASAQGRSEWMKGWADVVTRPFPAAVVRVSDCSPAVQQAYFASTTPDPLCVRYYSSRPGTTYGDLGIVSNAQWRPWRGQGHAAFRAAVFRGQDQAAQNAVHNAEVEDEEMAARDLEGEGEGEPDDDGLWSGAGAPTGSPTGASAAAAAAAAAAADSSSSSSSPSSSSGRGASPASRKAPPAKRKRRGASSTAAAAAGAPPPKASPYYDTTGAKWGLNLVDASGGAIDPAAAAAVASSFPPVYASSSQARLEGQKGWAECPSNPFPSIVCKLDDCPEHVKRLYWLSNRRDKLVVRYFSDVPGADYGLFGVIAGTAFQPWKGPQHDKLHAVAMARKSNRLATLNAEREDETMAEMGFDVGPVAGGAGDGEGEGDGEGAAADPSAEREVYEDTVEDDGEAAAAAAAAGTTTFGAPSSSSSVVPAAAGSPALLSYPFGVSGSGVDGAHATLASSSSPRLAGAPGPGPGPVTLPRTTNQTSGPPAPAPPPPAPKTTKGGRVVKPKAQPDMEWTTTTTTTITSSAARGRGGRAGRKAGRPAAEAAADAASLALAAAAAAAASARSIAEFAAVAATAGLPPGMSAAQKAAAFQAAYEAAFSVQMAEWKRGGTR
jgi:hypothetical protein